MNNSSIKKRGKDSDRSDSKNIYFYIARTNWKKVDFKKGCPILTRKKSELKNSGICSGAQNLPMYQFFKNSESG